MNAIIDITDMSDAEIDRLLGVCPFVAFADTAAERFVAEWLPVWLPLSRAARHAAADEAFELECEGEPVTSAMVDGFEAAIFDASVRHRLGLPVDGMNFISEEWM